MSFTNASVASLPSLHAESEDLGLAVAKVSEYVHAKEPVPVQGVLSFVVSLIRSPQRRLRMLALAAITHTSSWSSSNARVFPADFFGPPWFGAAWMARAFDTAAATLRLARVEKLPAGVLSPGDVEAAEAEVAAVQLFLARLTKSIESETRPAALVPRALVERLAAMVRADAARSLFSKSLVRRATGILVRLLIAAPQHLCEADVMTRLVHLCVVPEAHLSPKDVADTLRHHVRAHGLRYLHPELLSPVFAALGRGPEETGFARARELLLQLVRCWEGFFCIAAAADTGLRSLVATVELPGPCSVRMALVEVFNALLCAAAPHRGLSETGPWTDCNDRLAAPETTEVPEAYDMLDDEAEVRDVDTAAALASDTASLTAAPRSAGHNIRDVLLGAVLTMLHHVALPRALTAVFGEGRGHYTATLPEAAATLFQRMLQLEYTVLPAEVAQQTHNALDTVIATASQQGDPFISGLATKFFHIAATAAESSGSAPRAALLGLTTSLVPFRQLLKVSNVLESPDHDRWNFEVIAELARGHLRNPANFSAARDAKFFERVLHFARPMHNDRPSAFSLQSKRSAVASWGAALTALIECLLSSRDGAALLADFKVPAQLTTVVSDALRHRRGAELVTTLMGEYLRWVLLMTRTPDGLQLLHNAEFFDSLTAAFDDGAAESSMGIEVTRLLMKSIHFGVVGDQGIDQKAARFLEHVARCGNSLLRLTAVHRLEKFALVDLSLHARWVTSLLCAVATRETTDAGCGVIENSLRLLLVACTVAPAARAAVLEQNIDELLTIAALGPTSRTHGVVVRLFYFLIASKGGVARLRSWIDGEMDRWCEVVKPRRRYHAMRDVRVPRWVTFADDYDDAFAAAGATVEPDDDPDAAPMATVGTEPPHIAAALGQTTEGATILAASSFFVEASAAVLDNASCGLLSPCDVRRVRSSLLVVGSAGSSDEGFQLLLRPLLLDGMLRCCTAHEPLVRAAAITATALLSRSSQARAALQKLGLSASLRERAYAAGPDSTQLRFSTSFCSPGSDGRWLQWPDIAETQACPCDLPDLPHRFPVPSLAALCAALASRQAQALRRLHDVRRKTPEALRTPQLQGDVTVFSARHWLNDEDRTVIALFFTMSHLSEDQLRDSVARLRR